MVLENNCNIKSYEVSPNNSNSTKSILANQKILLSNQKKIVDELAKIKTMLNLLLENQTKSDNVTILREVPSNLNDESVWTALLPINSFEKLEEVEQTLLNKKLQQKLASIFIPFFRCRLKYTMSFIPISYRNFFFEVDEKSQVCGTSGKRHGQSCCYSLVDHFFLRNFLITCSWAGGSRENDRKVSFKSYTKIINTFFQIIHLADNGFSLKDCENFFKCVIKNAKRRAAILETPKRKKFFSA